LLLHVISGKLAEKGESAVEHDEIYRLIMIEGKWLIDEVEVVNEKIKPRGIEI